MKENFKKMNVFQTYIVSNSSQLILDPFTRNQNKIIERYKLKHGRNFVKSRSYKLLD